MSPESLSSFFHELTHASVVRFRGNGMLKRTPTPKNIKDGCMDFDETLAQSAGEISRGLLSQMMVQQG